MVSNLAFVDAPRATIDRGRVRVNGTEVTGWVEWSVSSNGYRSADTWEVTFAVDGLPAAFGLAWWAVTEPIEVEISEGGSGADGSATWWVLIAGRADTIEVDMVARTIHVCGRDRSAELIDARTTDHFANLTSSAIAATLAARHGLQTAITPTSTIVGRYYQIDHVKLGSGDSRETTEWNLLSYLAQQEGFDVFVQGDVLHFQPKAADSTQPYLVRYQAPAGGAPASGNFEGLTVERNLTLARDVIVKVKSWNAKQKAGFIVSARATKQQKSGAGSTPQTYVIVKAGLTKAQALALAQQRLREISAHERLMTLRLPPHHGLTARDLLRLEGTGTAFDQVYYIDEIRRQMSITAYGMTVRAKNHSPQSEVTA